MAGYTRQSAADIVTGAVATAASINAEFDQVQSAFSSSTGHSHSGVSGEGAPITVVGPAQDLVVSGTTARPKTDNTLDLGSATFEFKDGYFDGTLYTDALDLNGTLVTSTAAELNILDGVTATTAELNILDGVTSTTAELNILDGVTATFSEINILDGVTASTAELNILDGVTSTTAELNILDGVTANASELNILDGVTASTAEINILSGVSNSAGLQAKLLVGRNYPSSFIGADYNNLIVTSGLSLTPVAGMIISFTPTQPNTGAYTLNLDGSGAVTALTPTGSALPSGYIVANIQYTATYNGTNWIISRGTRSGSNANGNWTQFEDGTMICTSTVLSDSGAAATWTYPIPFSAAPVVTFTPRPASGTPRFATLDGAPTATTADFSAYNTTFSRAAVNCHLIAIGTWY